jgi:hypothetical protein
MINDITLNSIELLEVDGKFFINDIYKSFNTRISMNFIKEELNKEFSAVGFKNKRRNLRELKQVGTSDKERDISRKSLMPGKRMSKSGNVYWETRKNRSDSKGGKL